jgi:hypothetical protein
MAVDNKISKLISNQFPSFYKEEGPKFLAFMEAYYEYMEQTGKMTDAIRNLESYQDIQTTTDEFIKYYINAFLPGIPQDVTADKKLMVKYITQGNQSRGTLAAYKLLFRALYNEDVDVTYPSDQILKVSDGDWRQERYLIVAYNEQTYEFIGKTIRGVSSLAEALVEDVVRREIRGRDMHQLILSNIAGDFSHLEAIKRIGDESTAPYSPMIEAGIRSLDIESVGAEYRNGDIVNLLSSDRGKFAKIVVTGTQDLGGTVTFDLLDGGSGYTSSTNGGTEIQFLGGDGTEPASFIIRDSDIVDSFALSINTNLFTSNTIFGSLAPTVQYANGSSGQMATFANVVLSAANFGFPEDGENVGSANYEDQYDAKLVLANTSDPGVIAGDSLFGETSGANATVVKISRSYNSTDIVLHTKGYKRFSSLEKINLGSPSGQTVGTVSSYYANTIGAHELEIGWIANTSVSPLTEGTELVGRTSNAFGVVKRIVALTANGYNREVGGSDDRDLYTVYVSSNNTSNATSQFDSGPMMHFISDEGLRIVGSNTTVGNVVSTTSNTVTENIYTKLQDSLLYEVSTFGTISKISLPVGGEGYSVAPKVSIRENNISSLGIGEQYVTLVSSDVNWNTGNSSIVGLDTNDRIDQSNTSAAGDVKGGSEPNRSPEVTILANGSYQTVVRVWQDFQQRDPGNKHFANNQYIDLHFYDSSSIPGEPDTRTPSAIGSAKIVGIKDEGILGRNAEMKTAVGANGTITNVRVLDSGFGYKEDERVILETPTRNKGVSATAVLNLDGVANSEGYYASTRSQLDTLRGYIQDSRYYQEFSYEIVSPLALSRYRDYALELVHPAGQALFGKYQTQSNADITASATSEYDTHSQSNGSISITQGSFDVVGSGTNFESEFANGDIMIVEYANHAFYKIPINTITSNTAANLTIAWSNTSISGANAYYINLGL